MLQEHYLQLEILKKLLFSEGLKFSELRPFRKIENNQLAFHIESLIKTKLVAKNNKGLYALTEKGKEYANRMDTDRTQIKRQGKIGAIQCCMRRKEPGTEYEFLIYTRKKHPFYNCQGYPSGKVGYGETTADASKRELIEETNLTGLPELFVIEHHIVLGKDSREVLEDKYFYFFRYTNPDGLLKANKEGTFEWVKDSDVDKYLKKPFESVKRIRYITELMKSFKQDITFNELVYPTSLF